MSDLMTVTRAALIASHRRDPRRIEAMAAVERVRALADNWERLDRAFRAAGTAGMSMPAVDAVRQLRERLGALDGAAADEHVEQHEVSGMRYLKLADGTVFPRPPLESDDQHSAAWAAVHAPGSLTREDMLWLASVADAYAYLVENPTYARSKIPMIRRALYAGSPEPEGPFG